MQEITVDFIARICHNVNKAYCEGLGDYSQSTWEDAPEWQRESVIKGVTYLFNNKDATHEHLHGSWLQEKVADGWVYGEVKDLEKKTHPCMVPYDELPMTQRTKDYLFKSVVDSFKQ